MNQDGKLRYHDVGKVVYHCDTTMPLHSHVELRGCRQEDLSAPDIDDGDGGGGGEGDAAVIEYVSP